MRLLIGLMAVLLAALLYMLVAGDGGLLRLWDQAAENRRLKQDNGKLAERNRILLAELEELRSGLEGIEGLARDRLGMIREDEKFYQLVDPEIKEPLDEEPTASGLP